MSGRTNGGQDGRHISVHGATFDGGAGGIHIRGDVDASVAASFGGGPTLQSAVDTLVGELRQHGLLADHDLADTASLLELAARDRNTGPSLVRRLLAKIEHHPALTAAVPATVATALQAAQMLAGGGGG